MTDNTHEILIHVRWILEQPTMTTTQKIRELKTFLQLPP